MPDTIRKPVTPSAVPMCQRGGCQKTAAWVIRDDGTTVCAEHVGEMLPPNGGTVRPITDVA